MKSGMEPSMIVPFNMANAMPNARGTLVKSATISKIAKTIQIKNKTKLEFFINLLFYKKGGAVSAPPIFYDTENPDTAVACRPGDGVIPPV